MAQFKEDSELYNAATVAEPSITIRASLNALQEEDLAPRVLGDPHLPSLTHDHGSWFPNGYHAGYSTSPTAPLYVDYENEITDGSGGVPPDFQNFSTAAPNPPFGAPGAYTEGWRIPRVPGGTDSANLVVTPFEISDALFRGVFAHGSVDIGRVVGDTASEEAFRFQKSSGIWCGIGWQDGGGTRHVIEGSIRFFGQKNKKQRVHAQHFFVPGDLDLHGGDGFVQAFFVVIGQGGIQNNYGDSLNAGYAVAGAKIDVEPFFAGSMA